MQNEEEEELGGFKRFSDRKLLKILVIGFVLLAYTFIFLKIVFLK